MARILITGAGGGLGLGAARELFDQGHTLIVHARSADRAADLRPLLKSAPDRVSLVTGELKDMTATKNVAVEVSELGGVDAVIHNAGTMDESVVLPVNVVAPYLLTALVPAPRQVYLSSSMHTGGRPTIDGLDWTGGSTTATYSDSKLLVTVLAAAIARVTPRVFSNTVDPGWVPTRMGGASAPDDLVLGHRTQAWLAAGHDAATRTSAYWHHQKQRRPHPAVHDLSFQDTLLDALTAHTGIDLRG